MSSVLAVDLGGTKTSWAHVDEAGRLADRRKVPAARTLADTVAQIASAVAAQPEAGIGVIVPGIFDPRKGTAWAPNLWGWDAVPLKDALEDALGRPVVIGSDRAGYVLGEQWQGAARGADDVLFVAVGTGIGVGIIAGGRLVEGAHGIAGAAGWMAIEREWREEYAQCGCWEWNAAGPAVARRGGTDGAEPVVAEARAGNPAALAAMDDTADALARGLANLVSIFDPEVIVLGGGLMQAGDLLLPRIRDKIGRWAQPIAAGLVRIELTTLGEDAGLLGAARLAFLQNSSIKESHVSNEIL